MINLNYPEVYPHLELCQNVGITGDTIQNVIADPYGVLQTKRERFSGIGSRQVQDFVKDLDSMPKFKDRGDIKTLLDVPGLGTRRLFLIIYRATGIPVPFELYQAIDIYVEGICKGITVPYNSLFTEAGSTVIIESHLQPLVKHGTLNDTLTILETAGLIKRFDNYKGQPGKYVSIPDNEVCENWFVDISEETTEPIFSDLSGVHINVMDRELSADQDAAIRGLLESKTKVRVLSGPGGTGKTTIMRALLDTLPDGYNVIVLGTTGKAALTIAKITDTCACVTKKPSTIHSFYYQNMAIGYFREDHQNIIIVDETSMLSNDTALLLRDICKSNPADFHSILFIGDLSQLPPVEAGHPFRDLASLPGTSVFELTTQHRTKSDSLLTFLSTIRRSAYPVSIRLPSKTFRTNDGKKNSAVFTSFTAWPNVFKKIISQVGDIITVKAHTEDKVVFISHTNKIVDNINYMYYKSLTGRSITDFERGLVDLENGEMGGSYKVLSHYKIDWDWVGCRVVFTENNFRCTDGLEAPRGSIANGTRGTVVEIDGPRVIIELMHDKQIVSVPASYTQIKIAFASTIHKFQGGQAPIIIVVSDWRIDSCLLYTALSRAETAAYLWFVSKHGKLEVKSSIERRTYIL
jgi:hypothetical protein